MLGRRISGWILLAALTGWGGAVRAQPGSSDRDVQTTSLMSERLRLRMELDRTNAEIDALKRENRGLRDDYRLRSRMADAEALARRLTDLEARLPRTSSSSAGSRQGDAATSWPNAPEAAPSDDRGVLEAKADILSDQARRLNGQADLLAARLTELQARNELRRRAGQLERDPFSPLEQARRRLTATGTPGRSELPTGSAGPERSASPSGTTGGPADQAAANGTAVATVGSGSGTASGAPAVPGAAAAPAATLATTPAAGTTAGASLGAGPTASIVPAPSQSPSVAAAAGNKSQPSLLTPATTGDISGSFAAQFRGLLDATTLAEIRRLEVAGSPTASLPAMERALAALRARANELASTANRLRKNANAARSGTGP
jgi:hypothetical protein